MVNTQENLCICKSLLFACLRLDKDTPVVSSLIASQCHSVNSLLPRVFQKLLLAHGSLPEVWVPLYMGKKMFKFPVQIRTSKLLTPPISVVSSLEKK